MQRDWAALLTAIKVSWIDKGKNVGRGNINISCPWCINDPSYHLGIALNKEAYYCYREPNRHSGQNLIRLLVALKQSRAEAVKLLNYYKRATEIVKPEAAPVDPDKTQRAWDRFAPATTSERCLAYLGKRGFTSPKIACEMYDLRVALAGEWANRLLFPLKQNGQVLTWTGRALLPSMELRYLTHSVGDLQSVYMPDARKPVAETLIIVEGPVDALKVAYTVQRLPMITAALVGKQLGPSKLLQLRELGRKCNNVIVALDADVAMSSAYQIINELAQAIRPKRIGRAKIPVGYSDPGEIPVEEMLPWLVGCQSSLR